ncbi:glycerophosphodiester phosphodiesterase family protein [Flavobacterium sp. ASW18X]|uniref:glycerophosphodiester phosphodiesterase family protein n=1 Tax=Flavobacterium sp. ASW18X TaxID=2572595 RepID=UPI0010AE1627|nr:glycerophosphodiester phosphodiesterase family protein [Flavobacterium sp. ASW18X]TKD57943.1 glycerophosphodiester phosphodiesterase family protein [Flavobacterium sp. ASW18X]
MKINIKLVVKVVFTLMTSIPVAIAQNGATRAEQILHQFKNPNPDYVLAVSHRGDWRYAPENSLLAVQRCLDLGVDIIELDFRLTKDGHLVAMHDETVDRTTNGSGKVSELTLGEIKKLRLKNAAGVRHARQQVPTLKEVMLLVKGKAMVNLDKTESKWVREAYEVLKETGTIDHAIFKGNDAVQLMRKKYGTLMDSIIYMPKLWYKNENVAELYKDYEVDLNPVYYETIFDSETAIPLQLAKEKFKARNDGFMAIALWDELCAGRTDEMALLEGADKSWGWLLDQGANAIMTDRPAELISYLQDKGLRNLHGDSDKVELLRANLEDAHNNQVIVVAHRGDWRNAPENSLQAIQNCIDMGVDMVELDVRKTKDGQLILMHDQTIDRTTNGSGKVEDLTWEYIQTLHLKDGIGHTTAHKIPTLEEALLVAKGKILVNLDKSYNIFEECFAIAEKTGTTRQVVIKGAIPYKQVKKEFGHYLDKVFFMPIVRTSKPDAEHMVEAYLNEEVPVAFEFTVPDDSVSLVAKFPEIRKKGASVWVNSLWPHHNSGHDDEKANLDPRVYDWFINNHVDMIQTDRPQLLLQYLRKRGLHN